MSEIIANSTFNVTVGSDVNNANSHKKADTLVKVEQTAKVEESIAEKHAQHLEQIQEVKKEEEQKAVEEVASKLQEFVNLIDKKLQFSVDDKSGRHVVTVTDKLSGDVIRQIPSEEVLRLAQNLSELAETANRSGKIILTEV
jgi:flagellar protein FlaG